MKVLSRQEPIRSVTVVCCFFAGRDFARAQVRLARSKLRSLPGRCRVSVRQYRRTRDSPSGLRHPLRSPPLPCTFAADGRSDAPHTKPRSLHIALWYIDAAIGLGYSAPAFDQMFQIVRLLCAFQKLIAFKTKMTANRVPVANATIRAACLPS